MSRFLWTDEMKAQLRRLRRDGLTASQIAAEMGGGLTRNAIVGAFHRYTTVEDVPVKEKPRKKRPAAAERVSKPRALSVEEIKVPDCAMADALPLQRPAPRPVVETPASGVTLLDLTLASCRWPLGGRDEPATKFCGGEVDPGQPYCWQHAALAYVPVAGRRKESADVGA